MDTENIYTFYLLCSFIHPVLPEVEDGQREMHGQGLPTPCSAALLLTACSLAMMEHKVGSIPVLLVGKCNHLGRAEGEFELPQLQTVCTASLLHLERGLET